MRWGVLQIDDSMRNPRRVVETGDFLSVVMISFRIDLQFSASDGDITREALATSYDERADR